VEAIAHAHDGRDAEAVHTARWQASPRQREFGAAKRDTLPRYCLECDVRFACHGGCPKDRFTTTPDGESGLHYLCPRYKAFFGHIQPAMEAMCDLLRAGRAPSELVRQYAAADSRRGRNDPCPCGTGSKWKNCHLTPVQRR
jgi:uncharacterized protein